MLKKDKRVDAYIAKAAPFARPILEHVRKLVHKACPKVEETIRWGFPTFDYHGVMAGMSSFKQHCAFGFWKAKLLSDPDKKLINGDAMGSFGKITKRSDLPSDKILLQFIKEAAKLNEAGIKEKRPVRPLDKKPLEIPDYYKKALNRAPVAEKAFEEMTYSYKKDYIEWITEAKTTETRDKRIATSLEWIAQGKGRNWKYEKKK